jgi:glycosyltransferase involved in cell wall biosynthesis
MEKVLEGFFHQKRMPDEIIIADDGSGSDTALLVQEFLGKSPVPLLHVWQEDRGFRAARIRNMAMKESSGDYIILLDGDCIVNRHFISDHIRLSEKGFFIQGKRVLVSREASGRFDHHHANSLPSLIKMAARGEISNTHHLMRLPSFLHFKNKKIKGIKSCNMSFFRKDIFAVNGFNEAFEGWGNEDSELACRLFKYGLTKRVHHFMAVCFHLWHPENKMLSNSNIDLLSKTIETDEYYCKNGILKNAPQKRGAE